jgi:hypothetical protein
MFGTALSFLGTHGFAKGAPLPHQGTWPINNWHNHQPTQDQLNALHPHDVTPDQAREVDRLGGQPEFECVFRTLGKIGEGGVFVKAHSLWRTFLATSDEGICCALSRWAKSSGEVQRPKAVECRERLGGLLRYYHRDAAWVGDRVSGDSYEVMAEQARAETNALLMATTDSELTSRFL